MSQKDIETVPLKERVLFALSAIPDQATYQAFSLLVFTYYFSVIQLGNLVWWGFIIWTVWNMVNDPVLGAVSERTRTKDKWGKRKYYLVLSLVPLSLSMFFLFYVPFSTTSKIPEFSYFLAIIIIFEFFYTLFDVNVNAIFPEQFTSESKRAQTNVFIKGFTVLAVMLAAIPTLTPQTPKGDVTVGQLKSLYPIWGIYLAVMVIAFGVPFLLKGIKEKEVSDDMEAKRPGFIESLKITLTNKTFVKFVIANTMIWYVFNTLITIFPLYFEYVIDIPPNLSFLKTISLLSALLVAALVLPFHKWLGSKVGMRNAVMITLGIWMAILVPYFFLGPGAQNYIDVEIPIIEKVVRIGQTEGFGLMEILGILVTASQGIGLGGALFYVDIIHGDIIDEDACKFGVKRSGVFYGINAFIHRISTILTMLTIFIVFQGTSWAGGYQPQGGVDVILGLKLIIFFFPAIGCIVAILFFKWYNLCGDRLMEMREELAKHPELTE
jgi:GPH family glycoside/pentoside/hexuronide:cation symporter